MVLHLHPAQHVWIFRFLKRVRLRLKIFPRWLNEQRLFSNQLPSFTELLIKAIPLRSVSLRQI